MRNVFIYLIVEFRYSDVYGVSEKKSPCILYSLFPKATITLARRLRKKMARITGLHLGFEPCISHIKKQRHLKK
jgi:hypothetical protein